jgi:hypothetical protein
MATGTSTQPEQRINPSDAWVDAWIDGIKRSVEVQSEIFVTNLRTWRALTNSFFEMYTTAAGAATDATLRSTARVASRAGDATIEAAETMNESLVSETRRARREIREAHGLDALTVDHLDRLAATNNVDDYPQSGTKPEKVTALAAAGLSLEALTVEHLDRLAATHNVDDYPQSGTKGDKIAALEAAEVALASSN